MTWYIVIYNGPSSYIHHIHTYNKALVSVPPSVSIPLSLSTLYHLSHLSQFPPSLSYSLHSPHIPSTYISTPSLPVFQALSATATTRDTRPPLSGLEVTMTRSHGEWPAQLTLSHSDLFATYHSYAIVRWATFYLMDLWPFWIQFNSISLFQTQQGTYSKYMSLWGPYVDIRQTICTICILIQCCV